MRYKELDPRGIPTANKLLVSSTFHSVKLYMAPFIAYHNSIDLDNVSVNAK